MTLAEEQIRAMVPGLEMDLAVAQALGVDAVAIAYDGWWLTSEEIRITPVAYSTDPGEAFKALIQKHQHYRIDEKGATLFVETADETTPYPCSGTGDIARDICVCILLAKMWEK